MTIIVMKGSLKNISHLSSVDSCGKSCGISSSLSPFAHACSEILDFSEALSTVDTNKFLCVCHIIIILWVILNSSVAIDAACIDNVVGMFDFCVVSFCSDMINIFAQCHLPYHILEGGMANTVLRNNKWWQQVYTYCGFSWGAFKNLAPAFTHLLFTKDGKLRFSGFVSSSLLWHDTQIFW